MRGSSKPMVPAGLVSVGDDDAVEGAVRLSSGSNAGLAGHPPHCLVSFSTSSSLVITFMSPVAESSASCRFALTQPRSLSRTRITSNSRHICCLNEMSPSTSRLLAECQLSAPRIATCFPPY